MKKIFILLLGISFSATAFAQVDTLERVDEIAHCLIPATTTQLHVYHAALETEFLDKPSIIIEYILPGTFQDIMIGATHQNQIPVHVTLNEPLDNYRIVGYDKSGNVTYEGFVPVASNKIQVLSVTLLPLPEYGTLMYRDINGRDVYTKSEVPYAECLELQKAAITYFPDDLPAGTYLVSGITPNALGAAQAKITVVR